MAITITRNTTLPDSSEKADFHNLIDTATITGSTLDVAYDGGASITVDGGSVDLNGNITNPTLDVGQTGTGGGVLVTNAGTGSGLKVTQSGVIAADKIGFWVYSNAIQVNSALVHFQQDNASSTAGVAQVTNDGTGTAYTIEQNGVLASDKYAFRVYSDAIQVNAPLVKLHMDNASSSTYLMSGIQDGAGAMLNLESNGNGPHFYLTGDPTNASSVDGDLWFDGTNLKINVGGTVYNIDKTSV